jgi:hypothetical protein
MIASKIAWSRSGCEMSDRKKKPRGAARRRGVKHGGGLRASVQLTAGKQQVDCFLA